MIKYFRRIWRRKHLIFSRAVIALIVVLIDPLGIGASKTSLIDNNVAWLAGNVSPVKPSEKVAVVLIGDDDLGSDHFKMDWPFTYSKTASMVHALACAGVAGIFFDFTASSRFNLAAGQDELQKITLDSTQGPLCDDDSQAAKIPVFFGKIPELTTPLSDILDKNGRLLQISNGPNDWVYPAGLAEFPDEPARAQDTPPAFAIMRAACVGETKMAEICDKQKVSMMSGDPLRLVWSSQVSTAQASVSQDVDGTATCRSKLSYFKTLSLLMHFTDAGRYQPCFPVLTLRAQDLFRGASFIEKFGNPVAVLKNRFVFVGSALHGLNDTVASPVHGPLPGVYKHAVALDNLISFPLPYPTEPPGYVTWLLSALIIGSMEIARDLIRPSHRRGLLQIVVLISLMIITTIIIEINAWPISLLFLFGYYLGSERIVAFASSIKTHQPHAGASV
ncbi:CHASE2 domain-containing protein [Rhizobium lusitanum]|uniref:CHASE2 domain-containing protein n=1 Tax=Rhizobium lusitanum TaxID=293958 RepID=A0A6L9UEY9_9HYPH|nr:CHASE2 domain-containing protein [Rhizobium lusitanum]NEI74575.1 CHASE2 domain-containing protein [Rhizobium lusitanum]